MSHFLNPLLSHDLDLESNVSLVRQCLSQNSSCCFDIEKICLSNVNQPRPIVTEVGINAGICVQCLFDAPPVHIKACFNKDDFLL